MRRPQIFALLAVLGGAFLRFHQLGIIPPGLHYDFAANAILADDIAFGNFREVFISAYTGKETLFFYTAALLFKTIGSSIFTLQLTAAIYGVLGIAACYFAAREITRGWTNSGWIAAFAAVILSFTFMHLVWSRYGERATTEPFVQGLAAGFLFRGFYFFHHREHGERREGNLIYQSPLVCFALAGAFTGLAAYTYLAARLFPIPIAVALLVFAVQMFRQQAPISQLIKQYGVFALAALVVFAPLGWFFIQHPEAFLVRANQLTPREGETDLLIRGITGALGMIFIKGEPYDRFNIPDRPIYGPLLGLFFVIGLIVLIVRLFTPRTTLSASRFLTASFLLVYTVTFLVPTAISVHDIFPSNVRSMGLMPLLAVFPAIGIVKIRDWGLEIRDWLWKSVSSSLISSLFLPTAFIITLVSGTLTTYNAYFNQWATTQSLYYANDTDLVNAARWVNEQDISNTSVYFSAIHYRHPTVAYLAKDFESFRWFTGATALAVPEGPALYVFPHAAPPPEDWVADWTPVAAPLGPDGTPDFRAYRIDSMPPLPEFIPASANFGNIVEVTGYHVPSPGVLDVKLHVLNPPDRFDYRLVADLVDVAGYHWTQSFNDSYFSGEWQVGETILMRLKFETPAGMPPGDYHYLLTLFSASAGTNVPALTAEGYSAAYASLGPTHFPASGPQRIVEPILTMGEAAIIQLDAPPAHLRPGEELPFTIYWQAQSPLTSNLLLTTKLNDLTLESFAPAHDTYPFTRWQFGEVVIDHHNPRLPRDLAPGVYNVTVNDFLIGTLTVETIDRQLSPPSPSISFSAIFDDIFELTGYDLTPDKLTLYWHALAETDKNYTRFVHILDADGNILAQNDSQPVNGTYPTSLWLKGEYVRDEIQIPTGGAKIEVGWYIAETGERLNTDKDDKVTLSP